MTQLNYPNRNVGHKFGTRTLLCEVQYGDDEPRYRLKCDVCGDVREPQIIAIEWKKRTPGCLPCAKVKTHAEKGSVYGAFPDEERRLLKTLRDRYYAIATRCAGRGRDGKWYGNRGIECRFANAVEFVTYCLTLPNVGLPSLDLDRIDNDGHYARGNLQFVTHKVNCGHKRHKSQPRKD